MRYETSQPVIGDIDKAIEAAKEMFAKNDFEVLPMGHRTFQATRTLLVREGPDPLAGISRATVSTRSGILWAEAELNLVRKIAWAFLFFIVFVDGLSLLALHVTLGFERAWKIWLIILATSPLLAILGPASFRRHARKGLDKLLKDAAAKAEEA